MSEQEDPIDLSEIQANIDRINKAVSTLFEAVIPAAEQLKEALAKFSVLLSEVYQEVIPKLLDAIKSVYDAMYSVYVEQGAVYGDTHEGFMLWMEYLKEMSEARARIRDIEQKHQDIIDGRALADRHRRSKIFRSDGS